MDNNKVYITVRQSPHYHQMTIDELFSQEFLTPAVINENLANTKTYVVDKVSENFYKVDVNGLIEKLKTFNDMVEPLRMKDRHSLYHHFEIPKRNGKLRPIDAPLPELMYALRLLKNMFENDFHALYHTAAFAYVKNRCTVDAAKKHQSNKSQWYGKLDLKNFFGSTDIEFVMNMLSMVYPFSEVMRVESGRDELVRAVELAFLDGGLPQGTPISPLITNIMMIPIDFWLNKEFRTLGMVYTRYADDFIISSRKQFNIKDVEARVCGVLETFNAPFNINKEKTRYGSNQGSSANWILGVMVNKDNEITVGWKNKRRFQSMLHNYVAARTTEPWSLEEIRNLLGTYSYYSMVEAPVMDRIIEHFNKKENVNVLQLMKDDLK